jgi:nitroreductase
MGQALTFSPKGRRYLEVQMEVFEAIKGRRSIRHYKPDPLDDKNVQAVLEAAHWAPSWSNMQCWRFIVVRDPGRKSRIADTLGKVTVDDELVENAAAGAIRQAPVLIVVCAELGRAGYRPDGTLATDKGQYWYMFDIALAMQNLTLAAHALGLGTVIIGSFDSAEVARLLSVPDSLTVVTMTPLGIPAQKGQVSPRKALSEVLFREQYGKH